MPKFRRAFTLLETTIGLAIVCSMVLIASYNLHDYQAKVEEHQALEWFKNSLKSTFNHSYLSKRAAILYLDPVEHSIEIVPGGEKNKSRYQKRIFPKTLRFASNAHMKYEIYKSGQSAPTIPITIGFYSELTHKRYIYAIQMGWGEIIASET